MKRIYLSALLLGGLASPCSFAAENTVNLYNWSDYIDPQALEAFQAEYGIKVNYNVFDSNELLESKLMPGRSGFDVVVPSNSFLERQAKAGVYADIDTTRLKNYGNLDKALLEKVAVNDPGNRYGVPYAWGTIGLGYNAAAVNQRLGDLPKDTLDLVFKPELSAKLKDCGIAILDSPAEIIGIALNYLGLDPNSENKDDLKRAEALLKANAGNYSYFHSSRYIADLASGDVCLALGYNGDVLQAAGRAADAGNGVNVEYAIPREGTLLWFDLMAIPADAEHKDAAYRFIDFILTPQAAASISNYVYYAVPNTQVMPLLADEVKNNPGIYPDEAVKAKLFTQAAHTPKFDRLLTRSWTNVKTGR